MYRPRVFLLVAIFVALLETLGPPAVALAIAVLRRGERAATRATGLIGFPLGACFFLLAWIGKQLILMAGLQAILLDVSSTAAVVRSCAGVGLLAGVVEESIRFGAGAFLFRGARAERPLRAAAFFGLGWGGMEAALLGFPALFRVMDLLKSGSLETPPAWLPLTGLTERASAIVLHIAFTAFAVRAARDPAPRAMGIFAAVLFAHASIDAGVRAFTVHGLEGANLLQLEAWFAICAVAVFALAARLKASG